MEIYEKIKKDIGFAAFCFFVIFAVGDWILWNFDIGVDDSDYGGARHERSGLVVHTDALTGVQYLSSGSGLTPRMDRNGNVVVKMPAP